MRVRIIREAQGVVDGIALRQYHVGQAYDLTPVLAQYLVAEGYAAVEMRETRRSTRPRPTDRRRLPPHR